MLQAQDVRFAFTMAGMVGGAQKSASLISKTCIGGSL
jgi:hypothetical protein